MSEKTSMQIWYAKNRSKHLEYVKTEIECVQCNEMVQRAHFKRHLKCFKHKRNVAKSISRHMKLLRWVYIEQCCIFRMQQYSLQHVKEMSDNINSVPVNIENAKEYIGDIDDRF